MLNKLMLSILLMVLSLGVHAQQAQQKLTQHSFEDQWEKPQPLNEQTEWLIFSSHKAGGEWVRNAFTELEITNPSDLKWLYVADISAMPSLISRFVAIPKMQDYAFPIALEKDGELTANWPKQEETVSVYKLNRLNIEKIEFLKTQEAVTGFLKSLKQ